MLSLVKELIQPLLEEAIKTIALYPGKFKPPHAGHFEVAKGLLNKADEVRIVISPVSMDGITAEQSKAVWELYNTLVGGKFTIVIADKSPVKYVLDAVKENPNDKFITAFGKGEFERYKSLVGKPNVTIVDGGTFENLNARDLRAMLASNQDISGFLPKGITKDQYINTLKGNLQELEDYEIKYWALHADIYSALKKNPDEVYNTLKNKLTGERLKALGYFYNEYFTQPASLQEGCGCQHSQQPTDFKSALASLTKYMVDQGLNIKPLPKLKIINNDSKNAENILGRTAYYDPQNKSITLYTLDRHPKDVLRSYAHEMIHHKQNLEGRLTNIQGHNINEDDYLKEIELEAYKYGNGEMFRGWENSL